VATDWNDGLEYACKGGADCGQCPYRDIVGLMMWGLESLIGILDFGLLAVEEAPTKLPIVI